MTNPTRSSAPSTSAPNLSSLAIEQSLHLGRLGRQTSGAHVLADRLQHPACDYRVAITPDCALATARSSRAAGPSLRGTESSREA